MSQNEYPTLADYRRIWPLVQAGDWARAARELNMDPREDRLKVQLLLGQNMVVEAGAGTGKTRLLIERLCLALVAQGMAAEKLVALTFTEKAAAEIKNRLIDKLQHLIACILEHKADDSGTLALLWAHCPVDPQDEKAHQKAEEEMLRRMQEALAHLDRSAIGTIHSFCGDILRAYPLEAGLSPNAQIDQGARASRLFEAKWNTFLDKELGVQAPRAEEWKAVLQKISLDDIKSFASELCKGNIDAYDYFSHADLLAKYCLERAARAEELSTAFMEGVKKPRKVENALMCAAAQLRRSALYLQGKNPGPAPEELTVLSGNMPKGWDEDAYAEAGEICAFSAKAAPEEQDLFRKVLELTAGLVQDVRSGAQEAGILSFDDLIIKTRNLLQNNLKVRRQLKEQFDALFVDEFQDTDPAQGEMFLFLAEEKQGAATRWQDVCLAPGKLFVVGDPKQSIYRFRGADITAYELFTDLILRQGGQKCFLQQNFRSVAEIVDISNAVCGCVMKAEPSFQPEYVPIFTSKPGRNKAVEIAAVMPPEKVSGNQKASDVLRQNQAQFVADWLRSQVGVMTLPGGKKLTYGDVALLSQTSTSQHFYTNALRRADIAFNVEADKNFNTNQEVHDFLNFLRVVEDPSDKIALTGVLRGPLGGFTDEEVYTFARRNELSPFATVQDERLSEFYAMLRKFINRAGRTPLKELLRTVREETFLPELCAMAYDGERSLSNLAKLCALAEGYAAEAPSTLGQFLSVAQQLMEDQPDLLKGTVSEESLNAVSVMTVHKSKGLEFPVVILTDISHESKETAEKRPKHIYSWQYNMHGLRAGKVCDVKLAFLEDEQKKHARCEELRILYVALTRAKFKLLVVGNVGKNKKTLAESFMAAGFYPPIPQGEPNPQTLPKEFVKGDLTVPVHYVQYRDPATFIYTTHQAPEQEQSEMELTDWQRLFAARQARYQAVLNTPVLTPSAPAPRSAGAAQAQALALGTLVHKALELYLADESRNLSRALNRAFALEQADASLRQEAAQLAQSFVQSKTFAPFLQAKLLACEMPFSLVAENGQVVSGEIDAVAQTPQGLWIADYKTDRLEGETPAQAAEKYRAQLDVYRQAAQKIFGVKNVRCSVFFVREFAAVDL